MKYKFILHLSIYSKSHYLRQSVYNAFNYLTVLLIYINYTCYLWKLSFLFITEMWTKQAKLSLWFQRKCQHSGQWAGCIKNNGTIWYRSVHSFPHIRTANYYNSTKYQVLFVLFSLFDRKLKANLFATSGYASRGL